MSNKSNYYGSESNPATFKGVTSGRPVEIAIYPNKSRIEYISSNVDENQGYLLDKADERKSEISKADDKVHKLFGNKSWMNFLGTQAIGTIGALGISYGLPWAAQNILPYTTANGWLTATLAAGNTPYWLTSKVATVIDAALAGSATGASINDMRKNGPTVSNILGTTLGVGGLAFEAAPTIMEGYNAAKSLIRPYALGWRLNRTPLTVPSTELPLNVGWGPKQTIPVTHKSDGSKPLLLFNPERWDVVNEGANPLGIWWLGKVGIPRTTQTGNTIRQAEKAANARRLFALRPYTHSGDLTLEKPLVTIGDVPNRSALSYLAEQLGADGIIYNNVYDNGYNANLVILGFKYPILNYEAKYLLLLGNQKESGIFSGTIQDRSLVTKPFAEYLESLGINSLKFTESDLNKLIELRSKSVLHSIPLNERSAIVLELKPRNNQTLFSIDINEGNKFIGLIEARSHTPNHPRSNEVPIDMILRNDVLSKGLSEDAYNAAIDYVHLTGIGEGIVSGERLLSPEITYKVWEHYPNKRLLRTNGHHSFGYGRDIIGTTNNVIKETHEGPVFMLNIPSKNLIPMKNSHIFHPDMIKDGKLLSPDWNKHDIYYTTLPLMIGYGMSSN